MSERHLVELYDSLFQTTSINAKLPPVSYVKVVDVWLGGLHFFFNYKVKMLKVRSINFDIPADFRQ